MMLPLSRNGQIPAGGAERRRPPHNSASQRFAPTSRRQGVGAGRTSRRGNRRAAMKTRRTFALRTIAVLGLALAISATDSLAQQKQRVSFSIPAENSKYV